MPIRVEVGTNECGDEVGEVVAGLCVPPRLVAADRVTAPRRPLFPDAPLVVVEADGHGWSDPAPQRERHGELPPEQQLDCCRPIKRGAVGPSEFAYMRQQVLLVDFARGLQRLNEVRSTVDGESPTA